MWNVYSVSPVTVSYSFVSIYDDDKFEVYKHIDSLESIATNQKLNRMKCTHGKASVAKWASDKHHQEVKCSFSLWMCWVIGEPSFTRGQNVIWWEHLSGNNKRVVCRKYSLSFSVHLPRKEYNNCCSCSLRSVCFLWSFDTWFNQMEWETNLNGELQNWYTNTNINNDINIIIKWEKKTTITANDETTGIIYEIDWSFW